MAPFELRVADYIRYDNCSRTRKKELFTWGHSKALERTKNGMKQNSIFRGHTEITADQPPPLVRRWAIHKQKLLKKLKKDDIRQ